MYVSWPSVVVRYKCGLFISDDITLKWFCFTSFLQLSTVRKLIREKYHDLSGVQILTSYDMQGMFCLV